MARVIEDDGELAIADYRICKRYSEPEITKEKGLSKTLRWRMQAQWSL